MAKQVDEWELYYHGVVGRGEFVRILFGEAGVAFKESNEVRKSDSKYFMAFGGKANELNFPAFAPPLVRHNKVWVSQTNTVVRYVSGKLNLLPANEIDQFYCDAIMANIQDIFSEMRNSAIVKDEDKENWLKTRGNTWMQLFTEPLTREKKQEYYFGNKCSTADLIVTVLLQSLEFLLGKKYEEFLKPFPALHELRVRVEKRPNIAKFLEERKKKNRGFYGSSWY